MHCTQSVTVESAVGVNYLNSVGSGRGHSWKNDAIWLGSKAKPLAA